MVGLCELFCLQRAYLYLPCLQHNKKYFVIGKKRDTLDDRDSDISSQSNNPCLRLPPPHPENILAIS